jgi:anaerobic selenocysteine-containing dehydrogenase
MWERVKSNKNSPSIVVIDPRKTKTAAAGTNVPVRPKKDLILLYGIIRYLIEKDWIDREYINRFTEGFEELKNYVRPFNLNMVNRETGIPPGVIEELAGKIKGLWIIATNPVHSWISKNQVVKVLKKLDFLVVKDLYSTTDTALNADLLLAAAASTEKEGSNGPIPPCLPTAATIAGFLKTVSFLPRRGKRNFL